MVVEKVIEKKPEPTPTPKALTDIDLTGVRYPLKEILMAFMSHSDSNEQSISDEITLHFPEDTGDKERLLSTITPTDFTIHETFPILLL